MYICDRFNNWRHFRTIISARSGEKMIDVYSTATPNGHKVHILLEETGLPYRVHHINIGEGDQFKPDFLSISPNNKIPAIVDAEGPDGKPISLFESGAILVYLAGKVGQFLGTTDREKFTTLQWLMFQMGGVGPMLGQAHHFRVYAPQKIEYAINRYTNEAKRLYGVIDKQVAKEGYLAGGEYTIADIATFPWLRSWKNQGIELDEYPNTKRWFEEIAERPAVQRGVAVLANLHKPVMDDKAKEVLFGSTQYQKR
jgi:GST-like protein